MSQILNTEVRWTIHDVELFAENEGTRYEIVDGELFITRALHSDNLISGLLPDFSCTVEQFFPV